MQEVRRRQTSCNMWLPGYILMRHSESVSAIRAPEELMIYAYLRLSLHELWQDS